jgi:cytosine deaminase
LIAATREGNAAGGDRAGRRRQARLSEEDVYERGRRTLEKAIVRHRACARVEVDPRIELRSFAAIQRLKRDYAWAIDLDICVFPQEAAMTRARRSC